LRFGVQFADGRKATNLDQPPYDPEHEPDRPVLHRHGGGGGGSIWDMEHWVWPLPPTGPFAFVCEWPARGIAESRAELGAVSILDAAARAVTLCLRTSQGSGPLGPCGGGNRWIPVGTSGHRR
jgi:hypothetical protein